MKTVHKLIDESGILLIFEQEECTYYDKQIRHRDSSLKFEFEILLPVILNQFPVLFLEKPCMEIGLKI